MIVDDMHGAYPEMERDYEKLYTAKPYISILITADDDDRGRCNGGAAVASLSPSPRLNPKHKPRKNDSIIAYVAGSCAGMAPAADASTGAATEAPEVSTLLENRNVHFSLEKWTLRGLWKDFVMTSTAAEVTARTLSNRDFVETSLHGRL
jgi:hypothetical protein